MSSAMEIEDIIENFDLLDDWEDKYRYLIELGAALPILDESLQTDENKVQGCVSQVWLVTRVENKAGAPHLFFSGDSDAHIVKGLIAISFAIFSGKSAQQILDTDALDIFSKIGLNEHLTPQRSNGLASMVKRIRQDAEAAL